MPLRRSEMEEKLPQRKPTHLGCFDYATTGAYFVTICTEGRCEILSSITQLTPAGDEKTLSCTVGEGSPLPSSIVSVGVQMLNYTVGEGLAPPAYRYKTNLTPCGKIAEQQLLMLEDRFQNLTVDQYVIMPNHIHVIFCLCNEAGGASPSPTISDVVCAYKSLTSRICKKELLIDKMFQRSFYDHVIRNKHDYDEIAKYIVENPMRWHYDELYLEQ